MIIPKKRTLSDVLEQSLSAYASQPALSFVNSTPITYSALSQAVHYVSQMLVAIGIGKGDHVALIGENSPNWGIAYLGITTMGAVVVPVLPDFSAPEMSSIINHSQARVVFVSSKLHGKLNLGELPGVEALVLLNTLQPITEPDEAQRHTDYGLPRIEQQAHPLELPRPAEDDLAAIIYTSGTTGKPKGVMLTHKALVSNVMGTYMVQDMRSTDRLVSILPLPHTYECTLGFLLPMATGAAVYYLEKPPSASVLIPAMQKIRPTMMLLVPLVIEKIYQNKIRPELTSTALKSKLYGFAPMRKLMHRLAASKLHKAMGGRLRFFGIGGARLSFEVEQFLFEGKFPYSVGYGLTEAAPLISGCVPKIVRFRCAGYGLPNQEVKIHEPNPQTGEGEILVRGDNLMLGYYKNPELSDAQFIDGWLRTGDLGVLDRKGYVKIMGRSKNMILSASGENIYPEEIEEVINKNELVLESLVYEMKGKLMARVLLDKELIMNKIKSMHQTAHDLTKAVEDYTDKVMAEILATVNANVARF
ncbi:MAG: AMP-binding protein, partial [Bacteroidales bacterium]|nr:AMP-binding protein [Bacteroidales bacterium]